MADRDKLPCIEYTPAWDMTRPEEFKKLVKNNYKSEVHVADGLKGIEHLLNVNQEDFDAAVAATDLDLTGPEKWREYEKTLRGNYLQVWQSIRDLQTLTGHVYE